MEISMSEAIILAMALRVLMQEDIKPIDRRMAEELEKKIRIAYKGRKIWMMLFDEVNHAE